MIVNVLYRNRDLSRLTDRDWERIERATRRKYGMKNERGVDYTPDAKRRAQLGEPVEIDNLVVARNRAGLFLQFDLPRHKYLDVEESYWCSHMQEPADRHHWIGKWMTRSFDVPSDTVTAKDCPLHQARIILAPETERESRWLQGNVVITPLKYEYRIQIIPYPDFKPIPVPVDRPVRVNLSTGTVRDWEELA
jgi:hypothetical protein